jgi:hypothetical protein
MSQKSARDIALCVRDSMWGRPREVGKRKTEWKHSFAMRGLVRPCLHRSEIREKRRQCVHRRLEQRDEMKREAVLTPTLRAEGSNKERGCAHTVRGGAGRTARVPDPYTPRVSKA